MVLPEDPTPRDPPSRQPRAVLIGATLLILAVSIFALGSLTTPETTAEPISSTTTEPPLAQPTTTTTPPNPNTFRIVDIQQGHQLWWGRGFNPPNTTMDPIQIVELHGEMLLFGRPQGWRYLSPIGGVQLWTSDDGTFWSNEGEVIGPANAVDRIVQTGEGLVALTRSGLLLKSSDGRSWTSESLPLPPDAQPNETAQLWNYAEGAGRAVVFGQVTIDEFALLTDHLPDDALDLIAAGYEWGSLSNGQISIQGPWGVTVRTVDLEEAGAPPELMDALNGAGFRSQSYVWVREGLGPWRVNEFEGDWVETVHIFDDGTIEAYGFGSIHYRWTSSDGRTWEASTASSHPENMTAWAERFIGVRQLPTDLVISDDGESWEEMGIASSFPAGLNWWIWPIVTSDEGIAAFINGQRPQRGTDVSEVSVEQNGFRLTADYFDGRIELARIEDDVVFFRYTMWSSVASEDIVIDVENRTYTFHDPTTGAALVSFSFDELEAAERGTPLFGWDPDRVLTGLLYSHDGEDWTVQDITEFVGGERVVTALVTDDRVIAVTADGQQWSPGEPDISIRVGIIQRRSDDSSG